MRKKLLSILLLFSLFFAFPAHAQENGVADMTPEDYASLRLPPLDSLFENAKKNPIIQIKEAKKEEEISLLKKERKSWLKYLNVGGSYHYGIQANTSGYSDSATPIYYQFNENAMSYYNIGGSVSIPLEDLFDRKRKTNQQRLKVKEADLLKDQTMDELKQQIIEIYSSVLSNITILKLKAEYMVFTNAQYQMGENDFLNGKGDAKTLSEQKQIQIIAASDYESARATLNSSLLKLEMITRTPIIHKNKKK